MKQSYEHVSGMLELLSVPQTAGEWDRYVIADVAEQAKLWLDSPVFCLTRPSEGTILGVFRTRKAAKAARDSCFNPDEMKIEPFLVEEGYE